MVTRPSSSSSLTSFHILLYCLILILSCPLSSHRHQSTGTRCSLIDWERTCSRLISSTLYTPVIKHMRDCLPVMPLFPVPISSSSTDYSDGTVSRSYSAYRPQPTLPPTDNWSPTDQCTDLISGIPNSKCNSEPSPIPVLIKTTTVTSSKWHGKMCYKPETRPRCLKTIHVTNVSPPVLSVNTPQMKLALLSRSLWLRVMATTSVLTCAPQKL